MNCSQCNAQNQPDSRFCFRCGAGLVKEVKNSISNPLAILIGVLAMCGICAFIGGIGNLFDKNNQNSNVNLTRQNSASTESIRTLSSTPAGSPTNSVNPSTANFAKSNQSNKVNSTSNSFALKNGTTSVSNSAVTTSPSTSFSSSSSSSVSESKTIKRKDESINPSGATARCRDGTLSYSRNRRGTCSHHGGVAQWF